MIAIRPLIRLSACAALLCAGAAHAQVGSLYVKAGTLGAGVGYAVPIGDSFAARIGANVLRVSHDDTYKDNDYKGKAKFESLDLLGDWYLTDGFRLTAGALYNRNRLKADADLGPGGTYEVNGVAYPIDSASAKIELGRKKFTPYVGIGYSTKPQLKAGLGFYADLGVTFQNPKSSIDVQANPLILNDPTFQANLAEAEHDLQHEANKLKVYPVVSAGVVYGF
ncbi:hypothetical protein BH09PSE6_BH09PSE6_23320 [soil metagenome]